MKIIIDGKSYLAKKGETILEVAQRNHLEIPALCYHSDLKIKSNCRLCLVEIKGKKGLFPSCSTIVEPGMEVITNSPRIRRARKINLELIFAQHREECQDCLWGFHCQLLNFARKYKIKIDRFEDRKKNYPVYQFGPAIIFDSSKCIDCRNCVEVCQKQGVGFLETKEKGAFFRIVPSSDKNKDCIYCGQCALHCPAGAFEGVGEFEEVEKPLKDKNKIVIFQYAPSIRTTIGEEFGFAYGKVLTNYLVAGIKKLGVDKVFDVSVGADFTTVEEAKELAERIKEKRNLPMFTSCCPSWVKFVEFYYPQFIPHLTTVRSPHIILGGLIKTYWAEKVKIDPKKIVVVSIMPCLAKKYEITRNELFIQGKIKPVDYVLTTRELAYLFHRHQIDLRKIKPRKPDNPLGFPSGAGVIYGASGGVMESALRTLVKNITGKKLGKIKFKEIDGIKKARVKIGSRSLKIGVINGIGKAKEILEKLKINPSLFDYLEVMACWDGCIGGGGQPVPTNGEIRKKRAEGLRQIDKKKKVRIAQENPIVKKVYQEFLTEPDKIHSLCHTFYSHKPRVGFKILSANQKDNH